MTHALKALSKAILLATCSLSASVTFAESNKPEQLYPPITSEVLPELAAKGSYNVGVQTLDLVNPEQFDPATQGQNDRPLKSRGMVSGRKYSTNAAYQLHRSNSLR